MESPINPQVGDVLYLMATVERAEGLTESQLSGLSVGSAALVHGDMPAALAGFDTVLAAPDLTEQTRDQVAALRLLTVTLLGDPGGVTDPGGEAGGPASRAVTLCLRADRHWRAGELAEALWQNQLAENVAAEAGPVWHVYTRLMSAKRLVDMRVTARAADLVARVCEEQDRYGLHAFESIPAALEAALCLQRDEPEAALRCAAAAIEYARRHGTTVAVPRALAVSALAHLRLGDTGGAAEQLRRMRELPDYFVLPDTVARAALIEIAVAARRSGPDVAAGLVRAGWPVIEAEPASFLEDPTTAGVLTDTAVRGGDTGTARLVVEATEALARRNPGISLLYDAARYARAVLHGDTRARTHLLDSVSDPYLLRHLRAEAGAEAADARPGGEVFAGVPAYRAAEAGSGGLPDAGLTDREHEVAGLVGRGMTNRQVARAVGITEHTVNFHLRKIYRKLDISSRAELIRRIARSD